MHHTQRMIMRAGTIALLAASLGACDLAFSGFREQASETWTKTYPVSANGRVEVLNSNGSITVDVGSGSEVEVRAEKIARASTVDAAKELLPKIEIREDVSPDRIRLESRRPTGGGFGRGGYEIRYTLKVPAGVQVELQNTNGHVTANGITGGARLTTTNGGVEGRGLGGDVRAQTTNGTVELELASVTHPIRAETTNGAVTIKIPSSTRADINAEVTNGGIDVSGLNVEVDGERTRRRLTGRLNGGGPRIDLRTTNGGITLGSK